MIEARPPAIIPTPAAQQEEDRAVDRRQQEPEVPDDHRVEERGADPASDRHAAEEVGRARQDLLGGLDERAYEAELLPAVPRDARTRSGPTGWHRRREAGRGSLRHDRRSLGGEAERVKRADLVNGNVPSPAG